jgi:hypothetical protein
VAQLERQANNEVCAQLGTIISQTYVTNKETFEDKTMTDCHQWKITEQQLLLIMGLVHKLKSGKAQHLQGCTKCYISQCSHPKLPATE